MSVVETVHWLLPYIFEGQANAEILHKDALNILDMLIHPSFNSIGDVTPPGSPVNGDTYFLGVTPTGVWATHGQEIALYYDGWFFRTAREGMIAWVSDDNDVIVFTGPTSHSTIHDL